MGKRISMSQPVEVSTELIPLVDSFWLDASGELEQWYYENTGDFAPDRQLIPLIITPCLSAYDGDTGETFEPSFYSVEWFVNEWNGTQYVERQITAVQDSLTEPYVVDGHDLIVHRNISDAEHGATIRCRASYIDPRDAGYTYVVEETLTLLASRDATKLFPTIDIATESVVTYDPLKDSSSLRSLKAVVTDFPQTALETELFAYPAETGGTEAVLPENGADGVITTAPTMDIRYGLFRVEDNTFLERVTAGGAVSDISDGMAHVYGMRGRTVKWNQLIQNGDFSAGTSNWKGSNTTISVNAQGQFVQSKNADYNNWFGQNVPFKSQHVYIWSVDVIECNVSRSGRLSSGGYSADGYQSFSGIAVGQTGTNKKVFRATNDYTTMWFGGSTVEGVLVIIDNLYLIDLTDMFGTDAQIAAALGITTDDITTDAGVAAFESWLEANIGTQDYYAYDTGSLVPVKIAGMRSTGSGWTADTPFDITQLTGKLNGTGNSVVIFPDGMKMVGNVYDEIKVENGVLKAIKRVRSVDMGTATFSIANGHVRTTSVTPSTSACVMARKEKKGSHGTWVSAASALGGTTNSYAVVRNNGLLFSEDSSTDLTAFKASLSGVYFYFELATPQEYVIDLGSGQLTFEWYGTEADGTEVRMDTLPCYVSGQHTDTVTVDAQYDERTPVILRCKRYASSLDLLPPRALRTIQWRIPEIDAITTCLNGSAVREEDSDYHFEQIVNVNGDTLSDEVKAAHLRFQWMQRLWVTTKFFKLGWGQQMVVNAATLRQQRQSGTLRSAPVNAHVYINAPHASFELEKTSSPSFSVHNVEAANDYIGEMGGYLFLNKDGHTYAAKLAGTNWNTLADGTPVTAALEQVTETMVHVPPCHFRGDGKRLTFGGLTPVNGGHTFDSPHWVGAYKLSYDASNVAHSRPDVAPKHTQTMSQFWTAAQLLGTDWGLANYQFHCLVNAVYQAKYGNLNSQTTIGAGFQTSNSNWEAARDVPMGLLRSLGDGSGNVLYNDAAIGDQHPVKLFGFEDLWGKAWEFRPGIRFYMDGSTRKAVVYAGNVVSNTATGREFVCAVQSASGAYVKGMELGEYWDMITQNVTGGSATTYYCDGYYADTAGQLLIVGGRAAIGALCGLASAISSYAFSASYASIGARLAFYGEPEIVSGKRLVDLAGLE